MYITLNLTCPNEYPKLNKEKFECEINDNIYKSIEKATEMLVYTIFGKEIIITIIESKKRWKHRKKTW